MLFYSDDNVTLYHGDCLENLEWLEADVLVSDPPYGIAYEGARSGATLDGRTIPGDENTGIRDRVLELWGDRPALVFGTWKAPRPAKTRHVLVWDKVNRVGGYYSDLPWRLGHEEVYVLGKGFVGEKRSNVLHVPNLLPNDPMRLAHPTPKPPELLRQLLDGCPEDWVIADPFSGTGSTLRAAKDLGRRAIGCEIDLEYCDVIKSVCGQENLFTF